MENKVQQIEILGHTVNYYEDEEGDWLDIEDLIKDGKKKGYLFQYRTAIVAGEWWITNWEEIAAQLYNSIKQHTYQDTGTKDLINAVKAYEDAIGK